MSKSTCLFGVSLTAFSVLYVLVLFCIPYRMTSVSRAVADPILYDLSMYTSSPTLSFLVGSKMTFIFNISVMLWGGCLIFVSLRCRDEVRRWLIGLTAINAILFLMEVSLIGLSIYLLIILG